MRKALFGIFIATALSAPALAQEAEMPENYRRQAERNQAAVERQEAREAARAERQQQRMERQSGEPRLERREERMEQRSDEAAAQAQRSDAERAARREQRQERGEQRMEQRSEDAAAQAQRSDAERAARREQRQERRDDRQEQRAPRENINARIERERAQRVYPADMPENYRRQWDRNEERVARQEHQERRDTRRENRRDRRDWNNDRQWSDSGRNWSNDRRWDRRWRQDRRYDWQRYRYSNRSIFRPGPYYSPYRNYGYNRFSIGITLGRDFYSNRYWINDPWQYRLPQPYPGTRWVRYYNDVLLVDVFNGQVVDVIYDFFW